MSIVQPRSGDPVDSSSWHVTLGSTAGLSAERRRPRRVADRAAGRENVAPCPSPGLVAVDLAVVLADDPVRDRQAQAGPLADPAAG